MIQILLHQKERNDLTDFTLKIPTIPSLGAILAPNNCGRALVLDVLFDNEVTVSDLLPLLLSKKYLNDRWLLLPSHKFDLGQLFNMWDEDFKQVVRTKVKHIQSYISQWKLFFCNCQSRIIWL
jgi:hypothetical protein